MKISKKFITIENIILIILALFGLGVFNYTGYFLTAAILCFFLLKIRKKIVIDNVCAILILYSIFYFWAYAYYWQAGVKEIIIYLIGPWACYVMGMNLVYKSKDDKLFNKLINTLVFSFFVHGVLNFLVYLRVYGMDSLMNTYERLAYDFWRNEIVSVTTCSLYYVPLASFAIGAMFCCEKTFQKVGAFLILLSVLVMNITYSNRTIFYLLAILVLVRIIEILKEKKVRKKVILKAFLGIFIILYMLISDTFGVRTYITKLDVFERLMSNDIGRLEIWFDFLKSDWWCYPFGGKQAMFSFSFVHNLWLDVLYAVGIAPFILLIILTVCSIGIIRKGSIMNRMNSYTYLVLGMTIGCGVEPIMDANPYYFLILLMIIGAVQGFNKRNMSLKE